MTLRDVRDLVGENTHHRSLISRCKQEPRVEENLSSRRRKGVDLGIVLNHMKFECVFRWHIGIEQSDQLVPHGLKLSPDLLAGMQGDFLFHFLRQILPQLHLFRGLIKKEVADSDK